jgi:hypothetical protein
MARPVELMEDKEQKISCPLEVYVGHDLRKIDTSRFSVVKAMSRWLGFSRAGAGSESDAFLLVQFPVRRGPMRCCGLCEVGDDMRKLAV